MKRNNKKIIVALSSFVALLVVASTAFTYAWYAHLTIWNNISIDSGDAKAHTDIINRNFVKTYNADGTYTKTPANINIDVNTAGELPSAKVNADLTLDNFWGQLALLDEDNGYALRNEHFWFGFNEFNIKQNEKNVFFRGLYKVGALYETGGIVIKSNASDAERTRIQNLANSLLKARLIYDDNGYNEANNPPRKTDSVFLDVPSHMQDMIKYDESSLQPITLNEKVSTETKPVLSEYNFFNFIDNPIKNSILVNINNVDDPTNTANNEIYKKSYALAVAIGFYIDPMVYFQMRSENLISDSFKFTLYTETIINTSVKEFTDDKVHDPFVIV